MNESTHCTRCPRELRDDEAGRYLCRPCEDAMSRELAAIPGLYQQLNGHLQRGSSTGPAVSGSKTAPAPLNESILNLMCAGGPVLGPLEGWVRVWEDDGHAEVNEAGTLQDRVTHACRTLRFNLGWAIENHGAIDEAAEEISGIHRALKGITSGERPARRLHAQCPCGRSLPFTLNTRGETCRSCGAEYGHGEILRLPLADRRAAA